MGSKGCHCGSHWALAVVAVANKAATRATHAMLVRGARLAMDFIRPLIAFDGTEKRSRLGVRMGRTAGFLVSMTVFPYDESGACAASMVHVTSFDGVRQWDW